MTEPLNQLVFNRPEVFIWFLILIPFVLLMLLHYKKRFPVLLRLAAGRQNALNAQDLRLRYFFSSLCFLLFIAAMILALAGPKAGFYAVREFRRGADVVFAFDVSRSMNIQDVQDGSGKTVSRLQRSIELARGFIEAGSVKPVILSCGIAAGRGSAVLAIPVSPDAEAPLNFLDALESRVISSRGTNLEALLNAAKGGFSESSPASRFVVLFSDGEELSGSFQNAVSKLTRDDIKTIAVGTGSEYGALISENGPPSGAFESAAARSGTTTVRSYLHDTLLKNAAERSGGVYIDGSLPGAGRLLEESILPFAGNSRQTVREEAAPVWRLFAAAGLLFFAASALCRYRPAGRRPR